MRSQAWFWTPEWQEGEREASADIAVGRVARFGSMAEAVDALDSPEEETAGS